MGIPVGLCLAALLVMSGVVRARTGNEETSPPPGNEETSPPPGNEETSPPPGNGVPSPLPVNCQSCTTGEQCVTMNGVQGCGCRTSSSSDNFGAVETCSGSSIAFSLSRCQLFEAGINSNRLHLNNASCAGLVQNGALVFSVDHTQNSCGTTLRSNGTHLLYENSVQKGSASDGLISRHSWVNINFTCAYPIIQSVSMPMSIQASQGVLFRDIQNLGQYHISMAPYPNNSFSAPYSGNVTLGVNQKIFVSVDVTGVDGSQIAAVLDHCWATPDENVNNPIYWNLIQNDCPNTEDGTVEVLQNGVGTSARFSFRMFTFSGISVRVFLHCEVHLCQKGRGSCVQPCGGPQIRRRRRSLNYDQPAAVTMGF